MTVRAATRADAPSMASIYDSGLIVSRGTGHRFLWPVSP